MNFESALIIREPWITKILNGEKTWEMRSKPTSKRGWIGLVAQGGSHVLGAARLVDSRLPLTRKTYSDFEAQHAIPPDLVDEVMESNWVFPWVLADVVRFEVPVPIERRSGPVQFIVLEQAVSTACIRSIKINLGPPVTSTSSAPPSPSTVVATVANAPLPAGGPVFVFAPERARARAVPAGGKKLMVLKGSTAMRSGSPLKKRDEDYREKLVRQGVLRQTEDRELLEFQRDYEFDSASRAAGIIKDGNASGPQLWKRPDTGQSLKEYMEKGPR